MNSPVDPSKSIITRKRKLYKFALFHNSPICFEHDEWNRDYTPDVLEMGAGTGLFSVALAQVSGELKHVAVDVKADRLQTGARAAVDNNLTNVTFLRARADQLDQLMSPNSFISIWVTFPDPYPKERSAKNRLLHPKFLALYERLLASEGALYFKTDATKLFEWSLEQLVHEGWTIEELSFDLHESSLPQIYKSKTTYEARYMAQGISIKFVKATPKRHH